MKVIIKQNIYLSDDIIKFKFDYDNSELVYPLVDNTAFFSNDAKAIKEASDRMEYYNNFTREKGDLISLNGREIFGTFDSFSRIDGIPLIIIHDIYAEERNSKLSSILT